jgi:hypothetical protein
MIALIVIVSLASCFHGQVHGQELGKNISLLKNNQKSETLIIFIFPIAFRIINAGEVPSESPDLGMKAWQPTTRGQFIQNILFGIHPNSPQNRDAWAQSGYLKLLATRLKVCRSKHFKYMKSL